MNFGRQIAWGRNRLRILGTYGKTTLHVKIKFGKNRYERSACIALEHFRGDNYDVKAKISQLAE
jgi:hypothetical protein